MTEDGYRVAMVDKPMSQGLYHWKIQLDKVYNPRHYRIGVAEKTLDLNSNVHTKGFWGFQPCTALKFVKGS